MALWGNNDARFAGGTVSLNYTTLTVTGAGTSFGAVGAAATGNLATVLEHILVKL
jgi:hypothetical protein